MGSWIPRPKARQDREPAAKGGAGRGGWAGGGQEMALSWEVALHGTEEGTVSDWEAVLQPTGRMA